MASTMASLRAGCSVQALGLPCQSSKSAWRPQVVASLGGLSPSFSSQLASRCSFISGVSLPALPIIPCVRGAQRKPVTPRAADGEGADVPAFKGFPPMQTKPAWFWRILAVVPYMMPLCEAWIYSETAFTVHSFLQVYEFMCHPFLQLLGLLPSWFMLAYFFAAYLGVVRNNRFPHFLRFHVVTGMLMEIILQVVGTMNDWLPPSLYWGRIGAHFWTAIAFAFIFIVLECIWCAIKGMYADVPFISDAAYMQIPYE